MALLSINLLIALSIVLPPSEPTAPLYDVLMCDEVTFAVNEAVTFGTLTQAEADDISDRCYELYTST